MLSRYFKEFCFMRKKKKKKSVYLSGPISGIPRRVYMERFAEAERMLRAEGYEVVNPTRFLVCRWPWLYRLCGYKATLCYDLYRLMQCDGIYVLPEWEISKGARIEYTIALIVNIRPLCNRHYREHMRQFIEKQDYE